MYFAMLVGQVIIALIVTVLVETGIASIKNNSLMPLIQVAAIVIAAVSISASFFIFRNRSADIQPQVNLLHLTGEEQSVLGFAN